MKNNYMEDYNVVVLGNMDMKNCDCEGSLAVGKNLKIENFSVGLGLIRIINEDNKNAELTSLVVGENTTFRNCVNYSGNVVIQNKVRSRVSEKIRGLYMADGHIQINENIDFINAKFKLCKLNRYLHNKNSNCIFNSRGIFDYEYNQIFNNAQHFININLLGIMDSEVSINFNIRENNYIYVTINMEKFHFENLKIYINEKPISERYSSKIIWNFVNIKNLFAMNTKIYGTILAPLSDFEIWNSDVYGNVYINNLKGSGDFFINALEEDTKKFIDGIMEMGSNEWQNSKDYKIKNEIDLFKEDVFIDFQSYNYKQLNNKSNEISEITHKAIKTIIDDNMCKVNKDVIFSPRDEYINILDEKNSQSLEGEYYNKCPPNDESREKKYTIDLLKSVISNDNATVEIINSEAEKMKKILEFSNEIQDLCIKSNSASKILRSINQAKLVSILKFNEIKKSYLIDS